MLKDKYVSVVSMARGIVVLIVPEFHFKRRWPKKGTKMMIDKEILEASIYQPGVRALFTSGSLYIEDKDFRIYLGLEAEDEKQAEEMGIKTIVMLDDKYCERLVKVVPAYDLKNHIEKLSSDQKDEFVHYCIEHSNDLTMEKINVINSLCGIDLQKAIQMKKDMEA